jgi:hypothetical protein
MKHFIENIFFKQIKSIDLNRNTGRNHLSGVGKKKSIGLPYGENGKRKFKI